MNQNEVQIIDATNSLLNTEKNVETNKEIDDGQEIEKGCKSLVIERLKRFRGILIGLLSAFFLALSSILIRKATFVTGSEQTVVRNFIQMIIMICIAVPNKVHIFGPKEQRFKLMIRGLFGSTAILTIAYAIKFIDPSDAQALYSCRLIIISVLARIFLKEKLTMIHIICLILTITGVMFISQPSFLVDKTQKFSNLTMTNSTQSDTSTFYASIGVLLGLISASCASCVAILVKKLTDSNVHYSINVAYSSYMGLPVAICVSLITYFTGNRTIDPSVYDTPGKLAWQIFYLITSALCGCLFVSFQVLSNRYENANILALVSTTNLFWSFLLQYIVLNIAASFYGTLGALMIFLAVMLSVVMKILDKTPNQKKPIEKAEYTETKTCWSFFKKIVFFKF